MEHLEIWGAATPCKYTFDSFKETHGIRTLELVSVAISGHDVDVWIDEEGRISRTWAVDDESDMLQAIALHTDSGVIVLVGPVLITGYDFGALPPDIKIKWQHGEAPML